jgi:protein TonB
MKIHKERIPDLNDLAFSGRNKDYGSFNLRRKYPRFLLISFILAILSLLLMTLIPLGIYYFRGPELDISMDALVSVEYTFIPSPEDDLSSLAKALARPQAPPEEEVPQVVDTTIPEKKTVPEEIKKDEDTDIKADSAGSSRGQSQEGTGSSEATGVYTTLDAFPRFPGGTNAFLSFLRANIRYPTASIKSGIQGEVMILFMVEEDGSISNVSVNKGIGIECDEEAVRVIKSMPRWDPGRRNGRSVKVLVRMPIIFRIPGKK